MVAAIVVTLPFGTRPVALAVLATLAVNLGYSRQAFDHGFSGCRNKERCP